MGTFNARNSDLREFSGSRLLMTQTHDVRTKKPSTKAPNWLLSQCQFSLPCPEAGFLLTQSAKLGYLFKLQTSVGSLGFIRLLTYQLHKRKYKIFKNDYLSTTVIYLCSCDVPNYISGSWTNGQTIWDKHWCAIGNALGKTLGTWGTFWEPNEIILRNFMGICVLNWYAVGTHLIIVCMKSDLVLKYVIRLLHPKIRWRGCWKSLFSLIFIRSLVCSQFPTKKEKKKGGSLLNYMYIFINFWTGFGILLKCKDRPTWVQTSVHWFYEWGIYLVYMNQ